MNIPLAKVLFAISAILSLALVSVSTWTLIGSFSCPSIPRIEQDNSTCNASNSVWARTPTLTFMLRTCCSVSGVGALLQLIFCVTGLTASLFTIKSRMSMWRFVSFITILVQLACFLSPFTYDPETDSFLGVSTFMQDTLWRLQQFWQILSTHSPDESSLALEFFYQDYNLFIISLLLYLVSSLFLLFSSSFFDHRCCSCTCCAGAPRYKNKAPAEEPVPIFGW